MKKIIFLFSGSGLRLSFHAGVYEAAIKVFGRNGFEPRFIGCSGGSIIAAAASQGMTGKDMLQAIIKAVANDYGNLLTDNGITDNDSIDARLAIRALDIRASDLLYLLFPNGKKKFAAAIAERLQKRAIFGYMWKFEETLRQFIEPIQPRTPPFGAVATNLENNRPETFSVGRPEFDAVPYLLASCSIPGIFPHVRIGNIYYCDGAITDRFGFSGIDGMVKIWGWENDPEVIGIISDARPPIKPFNDFTSSINGIVRAYDAATDTRHPFEFRFEKELIVKNRPFSPSPYGITAEELNESFVNGYSEGMEIFSILS